MEQPSLKLVDRKWLDEAAIKTRLATGARQTLADLRPLAHPAISDYKLNKWIKEAGAPTIRLNQPTRPRQPKAEAGGNAALAWAACLIGWGFGIVGLGLNCVYAYHQGATLWQSYVYAALGGLIDLVSMFGLAWAFALPWHHFQRGFAIVLWTLAIGYSFLAGVGFTATTLDDNTRAGAVTEQYRSDLTVQLQQATDWLAKLRDPKIIDHEIQAELDRLSWTKEWSKSKGCTEITTSDWACIKLRQLKEERAGEAKRDPLTAEIARLTEQRFKLPAATAKDRVAEQVAIITAGQIGSQGVSIFRNIVPALMLMFSGALFAFSRTLRRPAK